MGLVISEGLRLKSYNTPAAIAGVAPTLDYRFSLDRREIEAISLTDKLTYTGATNGTFVNRAGLIERATTDQPRFDHGPVTRLSKGLLVEEQRTNITPHSRYEELNQWTFNSASVGTSTKTGIDGTTLTAFLANTASNPHRVNRALSGAYTANSIYTLSFYVAKPAGSDIRGIVMRIRTAAGGQAVLIEVSNNGEDSSYSFVSSNPFGTSPPPAITSNEFTTQQFGNKWVRISMKSAAANVNTSFTQWDIGFSPTVAGEAGAGTANSELFIDSVQLEAGDFPTSYIPTTTTALTRPVDSAVIDGTGVITGTYTLVEQPAGCAVVNGTNIDLVSGFTAERVMVFPAALSAPQITAIRGAM
jgi:hypothetical protein